MTIRTIAAAGLVTAAMATSASAAAVGFSDVTDNGGGSYTFTFDTLSADINGTGSGISFTNGLGLSFVATGTNGGAPANMIQDVPANGGLGVDGGPNGDNLGLGEIMLLTFNQTVNMLGFTLNGDHTDEASGAIFLDTDGPGPTTGISANLVDGVFSNGEVSPTNFLQLPQFFAGITTFSFGSEVSDPFNGYLESITVQVAPVPLPAGALMLITGLGGIAALKRRKKRAA